MTAKERLLSRYNNTGGASSSATSSSTDESNNNVNKRPLDNSSTQLDNNTSTPTTTPTTTTTPTKFVSAKDRFKARALKDDDDDDDNDGATAATAATTTTPYSNNNFKNTDMNYNYGAKSSTTTTTTTPLNFYNTKEVTKKKKAVNKPSNIAENVEEFKEQLQNGCIRIKGKYNGCEYNKYLIEINKDFGLAFIEYTENVCADLLTKHRECKLSLAIDKKNSGLLKVKKLPVRAEVYLPSHEYEFCFTITKPWKFENYIGIGLNECT